MAASLESLLGHLHRLLSASDAKNASDAILLERFVSQGEESAFAALLARHGPMVFGVCRRVLHDRYDAEETFQATFLVLARKAAALRRPQSLAAWLYGTARHLALKRRRGDARRRQRDTEYLRPAATSPDPLDELAARELLLILDEEMERLPETYRLPLLLCGLQGRTQEEAARILSCTQGSLKGRLERGRKRLHERLSRRGLALSGAMLALGVSQDGSVSAAARLTTATLQAALVFARGERGGIAATVLALAESGVSSMTMVKGKMGLMLLLATSLAAGTGMMAYPLQSEKQSEAKQATAPTSQERKSETAKPARDERAPTDLYGDPLPPGAIARLGTVRFRHGGWLRDVLISPDGRTLISAGDHAVEMWDAHTGHRRRRMVSPNPSVCGIALSPDGKILAVANSPFKMRFWDLSKDAEIHPFGENAPVAFRVAFSPNGKLLATRDGNFNPSTVSIWDLRAKKKVRTIEGGRAWADRSLAFSPNSKLLTFPGETGIRVWDVAADKELNRLDPGTKTQLGSVIFSSDGTRLAAASYPSGSSRDHAIHLWDVATGREVGALAGHEDVITAFAMSPTSDVLASASRDRTIRLWDVALRREVGRFSRPDRAVVGLDFSANGNILVSGQNNGVLRLWDMRKRKEIAKPTSEASSAAWVAFTPDGNSLISTGEGRLGLWEPLTGQPRQLFDAKLPDDFHPALSPDGKLLATVDYKQGQILLWDVAAGKRVRRFGEGGQTGLVSSCIFSADGRRLAGGSYRQDLVRVWDVASGMEQLQLKGQKLSQSLAFAPDGVTLASASVDGSGDYTVRLWNLTTGKEIWRKTTKPWTAFNLTFSPDGRTLALVGGMPGRENKTGEVRLWEAATGKELRRCEGHRERVGQVVFSADGRMLATGSLDNTIRLWEVVTGLERQCFQGHQSLISALSFSADGRLLASASGDTTALVWDLTGRYREGKFPARRLSAKELNRCWNDLADNDAARAYRSILNLTGSPREAVPFLKNHLPPVTAADPRRVTPLLAALDSAQFGERDKAMTELEHLGLAVEPALHKALNEKPSLEVRRRIEQILEKLAGGPRLRVLRALEVLEHLATPEARQVLEAMSQGPAEMWPAREAKAALARLAARPVAHP